MRADRGTSWSARAGGRTARGLARTAGPHGWRARLSGRRLRTDLGRGGGRHPTSRCRTGGSPRTTPRLCSGRGPRLHRRTRLLPGRSARTWLRGRRIHPRGCGWRRLLGRNPGLLCRRSSHIGLRTLCLPPKPEPRPEGLLRSWRRRRIPNGHCTRGRPCTGSRWQRRLRTKLGLSRSVRDLTASLWLRSWLSRRRLPLLRLTRRRRTLPLLGRLRRCLSLRCLLRGLVLLLDRRSARRSCRTSATRPSRTSGCCACSGGR